MYKIDVSNQSAPAAIDLMTARTVNQTKAAPNVALVFAHRLSKLSLTLMAGDGFIYADLVGMTVTVMGLPATADYNIATGAISGAGAATPIPTTVNTAGTAVNATAILIPQKGITQGSVQVFFNLADGTKLSWSLPATALAAGTHYQYKLSISLPGVTLISQNIIDWKTNIPETGIANRKYFAGDYYPDPDVTFSAPGVVQSGKAPVGIVIWIDPAASGLKGKIMSLDEGSENWDNAKLWRSAGVLPQAMTWDAALMGEYWEIYKTWNGSYEATINNTARNAFNQKLTDAGSTAISAAQYWSSDLNYGSHQYFDFALGRNISISLLSTKDIHKVRNVAAF
jgi:Fimbrillin-like